MFSQIIGSKSQLRQSAFWQFGKVELAKTKVNLAKYQSMWHTRLLFVFSWCRLGVRARETWSALRDEITIARTSHSLAWLRHNPFSQHSSRLLRAPSNALSLQLCAHVTQTCVVAVICVCVCVYEWSRCVWSKLRIWLLICWFGFFLFFQILRSYSDLKSWASFETTQFVYCCFLHLQQLIKLGKFLIAEVQDQLASCVFLLRLWREKQNLWRWSEH
jgi:hypothetical protein